MVCFTIIEISSEIALTLGKHWQYFGFSSSMPPPFDTLQGLQASPVLFIDYALFTFPPLPNNF
jgi:hypothetical protein